MGPQCPYSFISVASFYTHLECWVSFVRVGLGRGFKSRAAGLLASTVYVTIIFYD